MRLQEILHIRHTIAVAVAIMTVFLLPAHSRGEAAGFTTGCDDCLPRFALKSNLLHDAILTPDLGFEISLARKFSFSAEGVWAWWGTAKSKKCWRIAGGWLEMRYWLGNRSRERSLTGHHLGVYGSMHKYDFSFGHTGYQSKDWTFGAGLSYGYSVALNKRLNLDFSARIGYSSGPYEKYRFMCGEPVGERISFRRYIGLTGLEVTLVWFPGSHTANNPRYQTN